MRKQITIGRIHFDRLSLAFVLMLIAGSVAWGVLLMGQQNNTRELQLRTAENRRALLALCAFQTDLEVRVQASKEFLEGHPQGIPGISLETIRNSYENQKRTLNSIRPYLDDCDDY